MLSRKIKYAIKALVYMYDHTNEAPIKAKTIAKNKHIPHKFLEEILTELKRNNLIKSSRGRYGGYYFAKKPETITVSDVMQLMDRPVALTQCGTQDAVTRCEECSKDENCSLKKLFLELSAVMEHVLNTPITKL
ncbi:Rrf2 family transcriptional regulator [Arenibacter sp. GZD96]|uniref:RrF2 family transcriptional regulator n=1 Tax=Aurantibrevibacter litoralis TaxID=3106030 RepID=UPI002AFE5253|nr:Rrf2 family transcriptional regulator [Arenibacter sp. GZD-96]MEA1784832.1 Rrf2 family transcriptional regulator [Arenibacter sp. GZD-96]